MPVVRSSSRATAALPRCRPVPSSTTTSRIRLEFPDPIKYDALIALIEQSITSKTVRFDLSNPDHLPGDRRVIQSVELWYARANWRENRPLVRLWGRH